MRRTIPTDTTIIHAVDERKDSRSTSPSPNIITRRYLFLNFLLIITKSVFQFLDNSSVDSAETDRLLNYYSQGYAFFGTKCIPSIETFCHSCSAHSLATAAPAFNTNNGPSLTISALVSSSVGPHTPEGT
jgi:hypothetical protein